MWSFHQGMGWWMVFGGVWTVAFWALVIWLVVWMVSRLTSGHGEGQARRDEETPLEIARKRLARGEISREEYEELVKVLR